MQERKASSISITKKHSARQYLSHPNTPRGNTRPFNEREIKVVKDCQFVLEATRPGRCFMGPIMGPRVPIPVSSCFGVLVLLPHPRRSFSSLSHLRHLGSLLLCFLSRGIVAVRARSRKRMDNRMEKGEE